MKYDDASWHSEGDFPEDLSEEAAATHSGMFFAWALLTGLGSKLHTVESADELARLQKREVTPSDYFLSHCDGKLTSEDLTRLGNKFAKAYFHFDKGDYLSDYENILGENTPSLYHVLDTWENFDLIRPVLDSRYQDWLSNIEAKQ